ncbi:glycosyltransferase family 4 protein [Spongisporangium articulatum]|uniref:Glycosyltransferase family 4 protein n=1 Tax=Spongisporangium articulatum TaxID=3362603 RepID=A0ABW8AQL5_9ACTN
MSPSRRRRRASPEWTGRDVITVAALPGRGVYVRHLSHPEGVDGVHRPTVAPVGAPPSPRPPSFTKHWLEAHVEEFDVVHVQAVPPPATAQDVQEAVDVVRAAGRPLVFTAYHLTDPHSADFLSGTAADGLFDEQLDVLVRSADRVITLTPMAAAEIQRRWGVEAGVLPHPHVVDFVRMRQERAHRRPGSLLVGAQLGSLRSPVDPVAVVEALMDAAKQVDGVHVVAHVHDHLLDPESARYAAPTIRQLEKAVSAGGGVLRAHKPLNDSQLWDHLFSLDASFVPPLPGSHSIWPEACYDLGTAALMPADTPASVQRESPTYEVTAEGIPHVGSLAAALSALIETGHETRAEPTERWNERVQICEALRRLYEQLAPPSS